MADPKLKEAMAEIRAICRKHDIAGYITLVSPTHGEFGLEITPSWSAAHWEDIIEELSDYGFDIPHGGRMVAVVYPGPFDEGYEFVPYEWIEALDSDKDMFLCLDVADRFMPGITQPLRDHIKGEKKMETHHE